MSSLSPAVIAAIEDLELAARIVVEGLRAGGHRSPFHGYSTEFRQHRPYRAGDDLKHLDWKLFARSDRLYTRQFRETTNLSVMLALDSSASMAYPESRELQIPRFARDDMGDARDDNVPKFRYGQIVAAALAYLVSDQGHAVGLMTMESGRLAYMPARGGRPHLRSLIARIDRLAPAGAWDSVRVIDRAAELLERRGIIVVISDFYDAEEETRREMRRVAQRGHDVTMLQLISRQERALPFTDHVELEDAESGERRLVDGASIAAEYREAMNAFLERCRVGAQRDGVDYALMTTGTPPDVALREYLVRRAHALPVHGAPRAVRS